MEPLAWMRMRSEVRGRYNRTSSENSSTHHGLLFPSPFLKGTQVQTVGRQHVSGRGRPVLRDHLDSQPLNRVKLVYEILSMRIPD